MIWFLDFEAALDPSPTGIANVTMGIANEFLRRGDCRSFFFCSNRLLPRKFVQDYLADEHNRSFLRSCLKRGEIEYGNLSLSINKFESQCKIGIYPNVKFVRPGFDFEVQIIHDVVFLKYPQFHQETVVNFHKSFFMKDLNTNDLTVCVSDTTRSDLLFYAPHIGDLSTTIYPGVDTPHPPAGIVQPDSNRKPFFLLVGTIEPRKNFGLIIEFLKSHPNFHEQAEIIHVGRAGWLEEFGNLPLGLSALGFVSQETKWSYLRSAMALIFPSLYEGFGLPVIEAAKVGTPSLLSVGGSLPEVAHSDTSIFFNPLSLDSFGIAMAAALSRGYLPEEKKRELMNYGVNFTWARFIDKLFERTRLELGRPQPPKVNL